MTILYVRKISAMKYKVRLLLLVFCIYGFVACVFYFHYRAQRVFSDKLKPQELLPRQLKSGSGNKQYKIRQGQVQNPSRQHGRHTKKNSSTSNGGLKICREKRNFVFVKCMKCATESLETIFRRFGFTHDLVFVLPIEKRIYLGWPYLMEPGDYKPPRKTARCPGCKPAYNILSEHAIYNRTIMRRLMPPDAVYITIIRQPYSRFVSTFGYFSLKEILNITQPDAIGEYLSNYRHYENIYKSMEPINRPCIPTNFSLTENLMAHCLGMPLGFPSHRASIGSDPRAIFRYVSMLDRDFSLVMLVEYFHESLILLRRLMCWTFKDIMYTKINVAPKKGDRKSSSETLTIQDQLYRTYSPIDYVLYDYFNATFWKKVALQGNDFFDEVWHFGKVHNDVTLFCYSFRMDFSSNMTFLVPSSRWNAEFNFTATDCRLMSNYLLYTLHERYDIQMKGVDLQMKPKTIRNFC